jgi:hypothetical protein
MQVDRDQLSTQIEQAAREAFEGSRLSTLLKRGFTPATEGVKQVFGDLGHQLGYKVAAKDYLPKDEGEWLYDMVWFVYEYGFLARQLMVLESEFKQGVPILQHADVDGDFMKLVQARADVRVWLSSSPNAILDEKHIANCKKQIEIFAGTQPGDTYVFVMHNWAHEQTKIERFVVR